MKSIIVAANVTYGGLTYNTRLLLEYKHTGKQYFKNPNHYTQNPEIAESWKAKGKRVKERQGYYFISRMAIPTLSDTGNVSWWYINNSGDSYSVNKVSKYGRKIHAELSKEQNP